VGMLLAGPRENGRLTRQAPERLDGASAWFDFSQDVDGEGDAEGGDLVIGASCSRGGWFDLVGGVRAVGGRRVLGQPLGQRMSRTTSGDDRGDEPGACDREEHPASARSARRATRGGERLSGEHRSTIFVENRPSVDMAGPGLMR